MESFLREEGQHVLWNCKVVRVAGYKEQRAAWLRWGRRGGSGLYNTALSILVFILRARGSPESVLSRRCDEANIKFMFWKIAAAAKCEERIVGVRSAVVNWVKLCSQKTKTLGGGGLGDCRVRDFWLGLLKHTHSSWQVKPHHLTRGRHLSFYS